MPIDKYLQNDVPASVAKAMVAYEEGRANAFILHYNVLDYVLPTRPIRLPDYLVMSLRNQDVIVMYDPGRGIRFPDLLDEYGKSRAAKMEAQFREIAGLEENALNPLAGLNLGGKPQAQNQKPPLPKAPEIVLPLLEKLIKSEEVSALVILEFMEFSVPNTQISMMQPADRAALLPLLTWGIDPGVQSPVFMITKTLEDIHPALREADRHWHTIEIPLPDYERRALFIETWLSNKDENGGALVEFKLEKGLTSEALARATAGLTLVSVEDIFLQANGAGELTYQMVADLKRQAIETEFSGLVEFVDPKITFEDIGGLFHVKEYFQENIIAPIRKGQKEIVPMGVMMVGPAGTGKTVTAEAVAAESGINMLILRIGGQIASMWQGQGERNLRKVLTAAKQFTPVLIFIDEVDQTVSRGGGAGGNQQESRIFQMLLEFMSDTSHRGEVVFLAATNRPDLMDAALKRPGRFDDKLLFPVPEREERGSVFQVMVKKYGLGKVKNLPEVCLDRTHGWTGAEIESVARKARKFILVKGMKPEEALAQAVMSVNPSTQDIEFMTQIGLQECMSDLDYLPEKYRLQAQNPAALAEKIEAMPQFRRRKSLS